MFTFLGSLLITVTLGQATPAETAWLKSAPADTEAIIYVRGLQAGREDLEKMLQAMSAALGDQAKMGLEQAFEGITTRFGKIGAEQPFLVALRLPEPGGGEPPPFVAFIRTEDYAAAQKALAGKDDAAPRSEGAGIDSIDTVDGQTLYTTKGSGFLAFGLSKERVASVAQPKSSVASKLNDAMTARLFGGDVGLYVNVSAAATKYADEIQQARESLMGALDQAGGQVGGNVMDAAKGIYGGLFDALKIADALVLNVDLDAAGFNVAGVFTVKPDSDAAKRLASPNAGAAELLGKLPTTATSYMYAKTSPGGLPALQKLGLGMLFGANGKISPEMQKALDLQSALGVQETYMAMTTGAGTKSLSVSIVSDPAKAVEAAMASFAAMKGGGMFKDVRIEPDSQAHRGFTFTSIKAAIDLEKIAPPNLPDGVEAMKKLMGGDTINTWVGSDGKTMLTVAGPDWEHAKTQVDAFLDAKGTIGETAGFSSIRQKLPKQASVLILVSAQGLVKQMASQLALMVPGAGEVKLPSDMPKELALLGASVTATPGGYQFQLTLPSAVGPVLEKGLIPVFQQLQGQVNQ